MVAHTYNPSTLGGQGWITRSRDRDHSGQQGETLSLLKIQKLAGHGGARLWSQLHGRLRQENCLNPEGGGCGELRSCHCTPVWVTTVKLRLKKKKKTNQLCQHSQNAFQKKDKTKRCPLPKLYLLFQLNGIYLFRVPISKLFSTGKIQL